MIKINGVCYIIGASDTDELIRITPHSKDLVVAADGGYDLLKKSDIRADILIGDFDSIQKMTEDSECIQFPVEKDDTDSFLAYKYGARKGYGTFVVFGGIGGRYDHTLANIQMLANMAKNGCRGFLVGNGTVMSALCNSKMNFPKVSSGKFGVFSHSSISKNVSISGAKYILNNSELKNDYPLGVSNEFIDAETSVSVGDGILIIIWHQSQEVFLENLSKYLEV